MKEATAAPVAVKLTDKKATAVAAVNLKIQRRKRRSRG
jgi:hypothetical protein